MTKRLDEITDGVELVRAVACGRRVVRVGKSQAGEIVLEFENGAKLALSDGIGVVFPSDGAAVLGELREWGL